MDTLEEFTNEEIWNLCELSQAPKEIFDVEKYENFVPIFTNNCRTIYSEYIALFYQIHKITTTTSEYAIKSMKNASKHETYALVCLDQAISVVLNSATYLIFKRSSLDFLGLNNSTGDSMIRKILVYGNIKKRKYYLDLSPIIEERLNSDTATIVMEYMHVFKLNKFVF